MDTLTTTTKSALLNAGLSSLLTASPGGIRVALYNNGVEASGSGYARSAITGFSAAASLSTGVEATSSDYATFTASGGTITYNQVYLYDDDGVTVLARSVPTQTATSITSGTAHRVTMNFRIPPKHNITTQAELQDVLTNIQTYGVDAELSPGWVLCTSTVSTNYVTGGVIRGRSLGLSLNTTHPLYGVVSAVVWNGDRATTGTLTSTYDGAARQFITGTGVNSATDVITTTSNHGWTTGTGVYYSNNGGSVSVGLTSASYYYARAVAVNQISFHPTALDATNNTNKINLTSTGSETHILLKAVDRPLNTLFHYKASGFVFENMSFIGATRNDINLSVAKCPVGFLMNQTWAGIGTGKVYMRSVIFQWFTVALKIAVDKYEGNCDESSYYDVAFSDCETAVEINNGQGMGHHFWHPRFGLTTNCFFIKAGGDLKTYGGLVGNNPGGLVTPTSYFRFDGSQSGFNFGQNNANYYCQGLKIDNQATGMLLVNMDPAYEAYYSNITFVQLHLPSPQDSVGAAQPYWGYTSTAPAFKIAGVVNLYVSEAVNLQRGMFRWYSGVNGVCRITIKDCKVWWGNTGAAITSVLDLLDVAGSTGDCYVIIENCYTYDSLAPLADYEGTVTGSM